MTLRFFTVFALFSLALPASAGEPMTASEFESFTRNRTLEYRADGNSIGSEVFQDGQRVIWSGGGGECTHGQWYASGTQICFVYENSPEPHCWRFVSQGDRLTALFEAQPEQIDSYEVRDSAEPVFCPGVDIEI